MSASKKSSLFSLSIDNETRQCQNLSKKGKRERERESERVREQESKTESQRAREQESNTEREREDDEYSAILLRTLFLGRKNDFISFVAIQLLFAWMKRSRFINLPAACHSWVKVYYSQQDTFCHC